MMKLTKIGAFLIDCKIWLSRAGSYATMLNLGMLLLLVLDKVKGIYDVNFDLQRWGLPIFFGTIVVLMMIGYLDWRLGFLRYETSRTQQQNPEIQEIRRDVVEIRKMLEEMNHGRNKN